MYSYDIRHIGHSLGLSFLTFFSSLSSDLSFFAMMLSTFSCDSKASFNVLATASNFSTALFKDWISVAAVKK